MSEIDCIVDPSWHALLTVTFHRLFKDPMTGFCCIPATSHMRMVLGGNGSSLWHCCSLLQHAFRISSGLQNPSIYSTTLLIFSPFCFVLQHGQSRFGFFFLHTASSYRKTLWIIISCFDNMTWKNIPLQTTTMSLAMWTTTQVTPASRRFSHPGVTSTRYHDYP